MKRIAIVSPSGKFYGSEQVLFDFLSTTEFRYNIYAPHGILYKKLEEQNKHVIHPYSSIKLLYLYFFILLLLNKYDGIYINEAGHSKYINCLASIFPKKKFFIHIRLLEDCKNNRLKTNSHNISFIAISEYIAREVYINTNIKCNIIYDIYNACSGINGMRNLNISNNTCKLGIVGRVTITKGLANIISFCDYCENNPTKNKFEFHFFGGIDNKIPAVVNFINKATKYKYIKCIFHGFINDRKQIYTSIDILLHFNTIEPLGRIVLESLDYGIPFIGFNKGGVGELAEKFKLNEFMIHNDIKWEKELQNIIQFLLQNENYCQRQYRDAKLRMLSLCDPVSYCKKLESLFNE